MRQRLVYTRYADGGVSVYTPTAPQIRALCLGGAWRNRPLGFHQAQVERQIESGINPDAARRFVKAMVLGGCTTAEAWDILKDRDCAHLGYHIEMQDVSDLPADRWFRNAWTRSANGGPVTIALDKARPLQWQHMRQAVEQAEKRRQEAYEVLPAIEVDWEQMRQRVAAARDVESLRAVWPEGVKQ